MAVTLGFMLRLDNYLPAVAIPPQPVTATHYPPIEAEKVPEPAATPPYGGFRRDMQGRSPLFQSFQQPHTYNHKGAGHTPEMNGLLLDIYT